jgi:hypothetical protein
MPSAEALTVSLLPPAQLSEMLAERKVKLLETVR